ncbi:MAG TPA: hypothetical protein VEQ38_23620, partial [Verrucomicrobiae bacterium]|nr:hypothetical protein [Verrucomicrobiae bacterium]
MEEHPKLPATTRKRAKCFVRAHIAKNQGTRERYSNSDIGASNYDENLHGAIVRKTTMSFLTVCPDSFTVMMSRSIYRS